MSILLYEFQCYNPATGETDTLRIGSRKYTTKASDTPALAYYDDRLLKGGSFERYMFGSGTVRGMSRVGAGSIRLANQDRELDSYYNHGFDNQTLTIRRVKNNKTAYAQSTEWMTATVTNVRRGWNEWEFILADPLAKLDVPAITATFAGTNTDDDDLEGTAEDIKGSFKPFIYGPAKNVPLVLVNDASLIYACNFDRDGNPIPVHSIDKVYDAGLELNFGGTDHADETALATATISAGQYHTCTAKGLIRLNSSPQGQITANVTEGATAADRTMAQVVRRMITDRTDYSADSFNAASVTALDTANSGVVGIYVDSDRPVLECVSEILASDNATLVPDLAGMLEFVRLDDPASMPVEATIENWQGGAPQFIEPADENDGIAPWKIIGHYEKNYTVQSEDQLADSVTPARANYLKEAYRKVEASDSAILTLHPSSKPYNHYTLFDSSADALTATQRQLDLHGPDRGRWMIPIDSSEGIYGIGRALNIKLPGYDLREGKHHVIMAQVVDFDSAIVNYELWG